MFAASLQGCVFRNLGRGDISYPQELKIKRNKPVIVSQLETHGHTCAAYEKQQIIVVQWGGVCLWCAWMSRIWRVCVIRGMLLQVYVNEG